MANPAHDYFLNVLYPLQDEVLSVASSLESGLYLSDGTALSRGYLQHRFSEDLDFFADDARDFGLWASRLTQALQKDARWFLQIHQREDRLIRAALESANGGSQD